MEIYSGGLIILPISQKELTRQFRVLRQTLSMHTMLKDRYKKLAVTIDIILLACAVVFCATTFASDDVFSLIGLSPENVRFILGVTSLLAFFASLIILRVGWKGKAALHQEAEQKLTSALQLFRELRSEDNTWPQDRSSDLHRAYWEAMKNTIDIPEGKFVGLKSRHLRKVQISKMLDDISGCPVFVIRLILLFRSIKKALKRVPTAQKTIKR
jgi:hypothetical protein